MLHRRSRAATAINGDRHSSRASAPALRKRHPLRAPVYAPQQSSSVYYPNCAAARAAGAAPLLVGEPGYRDGLDRDGDGVAFERSSKSTFWRARVDNARTSISA